MTRDGLDRAIAELTGMEAGLVVLASSLASEKAIESSVWGHGALALAVLEAVQGRYLYQARQETPLPGDERGVIHLPDLRDYVVHRVKELTGGAQRAIALPRNLPKIPVASVDGN